MIWPLPRAKQTRPRLNWRAFRRSKRTCRIAQIFRSEAKSLFLHFNHQQVGSTLPKVSSARPKRLCDEVQGI